MPQFAIIRHQNDIKRVRALASNCHRYVFEPIARFAFRNDKNARACQFSDMDEIFSVVSNLE